MKRLLILFLTVILTLISGCASDNYSISNETGENMQEICSTEDSSLPNDTELLLEKENTTPSQSNESTAGISPTTEQRSDAEIVDVSKADASSETEPPESHTQPSESKSPTDIPISKPLAETPTAAENPPVRQPPETERAVETTNITTVPTVLPVPETEISPTININTYIDYAITCGKDHGLKYDSCTTACWDNPLIVGTNDFAVKRDINNLFDWYQIQGFTLFSVWAEERSDGKYDLFIGYA